MDSFIHSPFKCLKKHDCIVLFQATLNVIRNVVLQVLASNQKNRLLEEVASAPSLQGAYPGPSLLQGEAELAYLTHEGLFISDALNEAQQQAAVQDQSSVVGSRSQQSRAEAVGSDSTSGTAETSGNREQSFMYVTEGCSAAIICSDYSGGGANLSVLKDFTLSFIMKICF